MCAWLNMSNWLDEGIRPELRFLSRARPAFRLCGYAGLFLSVLLAFSLAWQRHLSLWVIGLIVLTAVATFLGLAMTWKILTGNERIVYYHQQTAVLLSAALVLWLLRQPILPFLDVTILGIGIFLVCGRVGCLMAGCCHGRPYRWGICYRQDHAATGFTPYYVGVRLFPIQLVESLWVLCIVMIGGFHFLRASRPGTALAWYVVAYGLGRFCFEFIRGDPERPYMLGYSQPQWISLLLLCVIVWLEHSGMLPLHAWHAVGTAILVLAMITIALKRRLQRVPKHKLLHPKHVKEVARAIALVSNAAMEAEPAYRWTVFPKLESIQREIHVACTSLGVQFSASRIRGPRDYSDHFALSEREGEMTEGTARILARLLLQLKPADGPIRFIKGDRGVFHLLIYARASGGVTP